MRIRKGSDIKMYKCIRGFSIEKYDDNGFSIEGEDINIKENSIWNIPINKNYRFIGGEVRLENNEYGWIELSKEHLDEYFKIIK